MASGHVSSQTASRLGLCLSSRKLLLIYDAYHFQFIQFAPEAGMSRLKPDAKTASAQTPKPPLFLHSSGQYAKKIRGKRYYFGADKAKAYELWYREKPIWDAGRNPRQEAKDAAERDRRLTVAEMVNRLLDDRLAAVETGELKRRTYEGYVEIGNRLPRVWGADRPVDSLTAADFAALKLDFVTPHVIKPRRPWRQGAAVQGPPVPILH